MGKMWTCAAVIGSIVVPGASVWAQSCPATPVIVAEGLNQPAHLVAEGSNLYYVDFPAGVYRVDKNGGTPVVAAIADLSFDDDRGGTPSTFIAVDSAHIYVMWQGNHTVHGFDTGTLTTFDKAGNQLSVLTAQDALRGDCRTQWMDDFAVAPTGDLYWIMSGQFSAEQNPGSSCTTDTQSSIVWAPVGAPQGYVIARTQGHAHTIVADAGFAYFDDQAQVFRVPAGGGAPTLMGTGPINALALDRTGGIFFTANTQGTFHGVAGGATTQISATGFFDLAFDGTNLFGLDQRTGVPYADLFRMKPNGHGQTALARTLLDGGQTGFLLNHPPRSFAVDDTSVYFFDQSGQRILKVCKLAAP